MSFRSIRSAVLLGLVALAVVCATTCGVAPAKAGYGNDYTWIACTSGYCAGNYRDPCTVCDGGGTWEMAVEGGGNGYEPGGLQQVCGEQCNGECYTTPLPVTCIPLGYPTPAVYCSVPVKRAQPTGDPNGTGGTGS
jgi:hypothetical protein